MSWPPPRIRITPVVGLRSAPVSASVESIPKSSIFSGLLPMLVEVKSGKFELGPPTAARATTEGPALPELSIVGDVAGEVVTDALCPHVDRELAGRSRRVIVRAARLIIAPVPVDAAVPVGHLGVDHRGILIEVRADHHAGLLPAVGQVAA